MAVGIWVVTIRIIIVGAAGIDGIEHNPQQMAFHTDQQVAGTGKRSLGSFAAATTNNTPSTCTDRITASVTPRWERIDDDKLEFRAKLGDQIPSDDEESRSAGFWRQGPVEWLQIRDRGMRYSDEIEA
jgi:hypothetical protein